MKTRASQCTCRHQLWKLASRTYVRFEELQQRCVVSLLHVERQQEIVDGLVLVFERLDAKVEVPNGLVLLSNGEPKQEADYARVSSRLANIPAGTRAGVRLVSARRGSRRTS